jgi:hypothetical protein
VSIRLGLQYLLKWIICQDIEPGQWFQNGDLGSNNSDRNWHKNSMDIESYKLANDFTVV